MPHPAHFTIRAASALTGINQNTLRAWERRHALLQPARTPKGYRLYSDDDLRKLRLIQHALQEGVSIGRVRDYLEASGAVGPLQATASPAGPDPLPTAAAPASTIAATGADGAPNGAGERLAAFAARIEAAALRLDRSALERAFCRAVGLHSLRQAFTHALAPALTRLGQHGPEDRAQAAAERFLTAFAREKLLGALAGLRPLHQQPRVLFACLPGERHELMLMLLSLEVGLEGVSALYLGPDAPVEAVQQAAAAANSRAIAASAFGELPRETVLDLRARLECLPRRPRLLLGGPAAWKDREWLEARGVEVLSRDTGEAGAQVLRAVGQA